jgi:uncharacterized UPF0160 family protein
MKNNQSEYIIAAHNGVFHADDVFAVATLLVLFEGKAGDVMADLRPLKVIRTRTPEEIETADFVVDVGGVSDPARGRFDHHQIGGAGERPNGIPYASFGLVWKHFGEKICGSKDVADMVDQKLVQPIDALDNGVSIVKEIFAGIRPYDLSAIIGGMNPNWNEKESISDENFMSAVSLAKGILTREIIAAKADIAGMRFVDDVYHSTEDKRVIVLDRDYPWERILSNYPEPLFVLYPKDSTWRIKTVRKGLQTFENRKDLPAAWAGKKGAELSAITGVPGGIFCHNKLFMAAAETKEAALAMVGRALNS